MGRAGCWVVLVSASLIATSPPRQSPASPSDRPDAQENEAVVALLRRELLGHIAELLVPPRVHRLAARGTLEFKESWQAEDEPTPVFFGDYALDIPLSHFEEAGPPLRFARSPLFVLRDGWRIVITRREDHLAPHLTDVAAGFAHMIPDDMAKRHEAFLDALAAGLERRLTFSQDYDVLEKVYNMSFDNVRANDLGLGELVETWTWLEVKRISNRTGSDEYVAFARTPRFRVATYGSLDHANGLWVDVHDGPKGITLRFVKGREQEAPSRAITPHVNRMVASVRRHGSDTPGRDMRLAALRALKHPSRQKAREMARCLLLVGIQYRDEVSESIRLLRSLLDPRDEDSGDFAEMLRRSEQGLCMGCGNKTEGDRSEPCARCGYTPWPRKEFPPHPRAGSGPP